MNTIQQPPSQTASNRNTINAAHPLKGQAFPVTSQGQIVNQQQVQITTNAQIGSSINYKQELQERQNEINKLLREKNMIERERINLQTENQNLRSVINNNKVIFEKQLEEKSFQLSQIKSDQINYKGMKKTLEEQIDEINRQRQKELEIHNKEVQTIRERQKTLIEDLQEQRRKYDHLHFYLERNAKQFEFEEEQLKTQLKIKDQEILNLEKQLEKLQTSQNLGSKDQVSNLVAENENLKFKLSEMATKLNSYADLQRKFTENQSDRKDLEVQQIETKLRLEQERIISKKTVELEDQYSRLNQEVMYLRQREKQLQIENEDFRDKAKKMAETVNETIQQSNMWKEKYQIAINSQTGNNADVNILRNTIQQKEQVIIQQENMLKNMTSEIGVYKNQQYSNRPSNVNNNAEVAILQNENNNQAEIIKNLQDQLGEQQEESRKKSRNTQQNQQQVVQYVANDQEIIDRNAKLEIANRTLAETVADLEFRLSRLGETQPAKLGQPLSQRNSTYQYQVSNTMGATSSNNYPNIIVNSPLAYSTQAPNVYSSQAQGNGTYSTQANATYGTQANATYGSQGPAQYTYTFNVDNGAQGSQYAYK